MTYFIKFHLKTNYQGNTIPVIYGSLPELGGGNSAKGIPLKHTNSIYNYVAEIRVKKPKNNEEVHWYSYCYRPSFGATVYETVSKRNMPKLSNLSGGNIELYDSSKSVMSISNLVVRFRVKLQTEYGNELYIIGDCKELGNWQTKGAQQLFFDKESQSWMGDICFPLTSTSRTIQYKYILTTQIDEIRWEPEENHIIHLDPVTSPAFIEVSDTYRWTDPILNVFTRSAFTSVLTKRNYPIPPPRISPNSVLPGQISLIFSVLCPYIKKNQTLAVVGSCPALGEWNPERAIPLTDSEFPLWIGSINVSRDAFPFQYKYVIYDNESNDQTSTETTNDEDIKQDRYIWEQGDNHQCLGVTSDLVDYSFPSTVLITDWYVSPNKDMFRGMGIHLPLFSLRTSENCGIGEYSDIRRLVDLCKSIGSSMIQLLPLNDTSGSCNANDTRDKYPYNSISCFALHPIYINLLEILPNLPSEIYNEILSRRYEFQQNNVVNYQQIYRFKLSILHKIFTRFGDELINDKEFIDFCKNNEDWLIPYSVFCLLRDENGTSEFWTWKDRTLRLITPDNINRIYQQREKDTLITRWIQFIADQQLHASREYATAQRVILKTDIPFGVQRNSVDVWSNPRLFDLSMYEGASSPKSDTNCINYGYAAYNWRAMKSNGYLWWRLRLKRVSNLYHAAQINHISGFFRSWQIPADTPFYGVMGHFQPCNGISRQELERRGLWDIDRYTKPYIRFHILRDKFHNDASQIAADFFVARNVDQHDDYFDFKESFHSIKSINEQLEVTIPELEKRNAYSKHLLELLDNVILIRGTNYSNDSKNKKEGEVFHFRADITAESVQDGTIIPSSSFIELDIVQRQGILDLYHEYKFNRQKETWINEAIPKLEMLEKSNQLLIFSEDKENLDNEFQHEIEFKSILQLKVPRFNSSNNGKPFETSTSLPYMSQCEPALPDTSTIRGWYEENKNTTITFCKEELGLNGNEIQEYCYTDSLVKIVNKYLNSPSMWCVFMLQDIVNTFNRLRKEYPNDERIFASTQFGAVIEQNQYENNNLYRFPWKLDDLNNDTEWTNYICSLVKNAQRC